MPLFLVADVGGTNSRFALSDGPVLRTDTIRRLPNDDHATFFDAMRAYLSETGAAPEGVAIAIAGPVEGDRGHLTNRDWHFDEKSLRRTSGAARAAIFNDLQGQGLGLIQSAGTEHRALRPGTPHPGAPRIVLNVGTGLNIATVWTLEQGPHVSSAEAGHITLPARGAEQVRLAEHLASEHGFAAAEEVLSGRGLAAPHHWRTGETLSAAEVSLRANAGEAGATGTARLFAHILGQYAGDLALVQLAFGGIFLVGGVARSLAGFISGPDYAEGFLDKGRFAEFLAPIPSYLVEDDYAPLHGLAGHLARLTSLDAMRH